MKTMYVVKDAIGKNVLTTAGWQYMINNWTPNHWRQFDTEQDAQAAIDNAPYPYDHSYAVIEPFEKEVIF